MSKTWRENNTLRMRESLDGVSLELTDKVFEVVGEGTSRFTDLDDIIDMAEEYVSGNYEPDEMEGFYQAVHIPEVKVSYPEGEEITTLELEIDLVSDEVRLSAPDLSPSLNRAIENMDRREIETFLKKGFID